MLYQELNISKKCFNNQATLVIPITKKKNINVKIFPNGKIQFTGCKNIVDLEKAFNILYKNLLSNTNRLVLEDDIIISKLDFQMINVKYMAGFKIIRENLVPILRQKYYDKCTCKYFPVNYSGINIKYNTGNVTNSILIFQSGKIIISSSKSINNLIKTFNFIKEVLEKEYINIVRIEYHSSNNL